MKAGSTPYGRRGVKRLQRTSTWTLAAAAHLTAVIYLAAITRCSSGLANVTPTDCVTNFAARLKEWVCVSEEEEYLSFTEQLVEKSLLPCLDNALPQQVSSFLLPVSGVDGPYHDLFEPQRIAFNNQTGVRQKVVFDPAASWQAGVNELLVEHNNNLTSSSHPGFFMFGRYMIDLLADGIAQDISSFIPESNLNWTDILSSLRDVRAFYNGQVIGVPLDSRVLSTMFRRDVLTANSLNVPQTWDEILEAVAAVNGTDMDGDGQPDWGACISLLGLKPNTRTCAAAFQVLSSMLPTFTQATGLSQGSFIDPRTLQPLLTSQAGYEVMGILERLKPYMHPLSFQTCSSVDTAFVEGHCAFSVLARPATFKASQLLSANITLRGKVGVMPAPGSTRILDRTTGKLEPCTNHTCPLALERILPNGTHQYVNQVAALDVGMMMGINSVSTGTMQRAAFQFITQVSVSQDTFQLILRPDTPYGPVRTSHLELEDWVNAGYDSQDARDYLDVVAWAFSRARNIATDVSVPGCSSSKDATSGLLSNYFVGNLTLSEVVPQLQNLWTDVIKQIGVQKFTQLYQASLLWKPPEMAHSPPPLVTTNNTSLYKVSITIPGRSERVTAISVSCAVGGSLLLLAMVLTGLYYKFSKTRAFFGKVTRTILGKTLPPGAGTATTLIVTDIQDSTILWESLPQPVMDEVLKLHHSCLRSLLKKYDGYESTTEGDAFILAFHTADNAFSYALAAQQALLGLEWPQLLLLQLLCQPIHVKLIGRDPTESEQMSRFKRKQLSIQRWLLTSTVEPDTDAQSHAFTVDSSPPPDDSTPAGDTQNDLSCKETLNFLSCCRDTWRSDDVDVPEGDCNLVFRGVRVRMGLHSGVPDGTVTQNASDHRMHYSGRTLTTAKLVADCGQGGVITMSHDTYTQLCMEEHWDHAVVMHNGLHQLERDSEPMHIYQAFCRNLIGRLSIVGPVRSLRCLESGVFDAPIGELAICYLKVAGFDSLTHWDQQATQRSTDLFHQIALKELIGHSGYAVETKPDLLLTAFADCTQAALWALNTLRQCIDAGWPQELLDCELGQEVSMVVPCWDGSCRSQLMMRGLRLKAGLDRGPVMSSLQPITGKLGYRGRTMNRAARIAGQASSQQVICSQSLWDTICERTQRKHLMAAPLGSVKLKGIHEDVQLLQLRLEAAPDEAQQVPQTSYTGSALCKSSPYIPDSPTSRSLLFKPGFPSLKRKGLQPLHTNADD